MNIQLRDCSWQIIGDCHWAIQSASSLSKLAKRSLEHRELRQCESFAPFFPYLRETLTLFDRYPQKYEALEHNLQRTTYCYAPNTSYTSVTLSNDNKIQLIDGFRTDKQYAELLRFFNLLHEYHHLASLKMNNGVAHYGFSTTFPNGAIEKEGFNEGCTQYFTSYKLRLPNIFLPIAERVGQNGILHHYSNSMLEAYLCRSFCDIFDIREVEPLYYANDIDTLMEMMMPYQSEQNITSFFVGLDLLQEKEKLFYQNKGEYPEKTVSQLRDFLISTYENKQKRSFFKVGEKNFYDHLILGVDDGKIPYTKSSFTRR